MTPLALDPCQILPIEMRCRFMSHLPLKDLFSASQVSKSWNLATIDGFYLYKCARIITLFNVFSEVCLCVGDQKKEGALQSKVIAQLSSRKIFEEKIEVPRNENKPWYRFIIDYLRSYLLEKTLYRQMLEATFSMLESHGDYLFIFELQKACYNRYFLHAVEYFKNIPRQFIVGIHDISRLNENLSNPKITTLSISRDVCQNLEVQNAIKCSLSASKVKMLLFTGIEFEKDSGIEGILNLFLEHQKIELVITFNSGITDKETIAIAKFITSLGSNLGMCVLYFEPQLSNIGLKEIAKALILSPNCHFHMYYEDPSPITEGLKALEAVDPDGKRIKLAHQLLQ